MDEPALTLARVQFGLTAAFHYLYPPLSIGLGLFLVFVEGAWLRTRDPVWRQVARFWTKVFALTFAIGVATGLVLEFEFGTNWSAYSRYVGDVFGSALAAEGIFAFFLESGFLAVLLFGWDRVGPKLHFFATTMVCLGAHFSAVWIVVANSWMHTPAGYHVVQGPNGPRAEITDFTALVFNPSSMDRLSHVLVGAWMAGAFLVVSVSAWYLLKGLHHEFARRSLRVGLAFAAAASLLQLVTGHSSAIGVAANQPAKLAAMEGHYRSGTPAALTIAGWVDEDAGEVRGLAVPGGTSLMIHGDTAAPVTGLDAFPPEDRPPVQPVFQAYHLMVAVGFSLIAISVAGFVWLRTGGLERRRWMLRVLVLAVLGPQIANQAGWFAAEVGRQPWIVQGILRTRDGVSPHVTSSQIVTSLVLFTAVYALLFVTFLYLLDDKIRHGPDPDDAGPLVPLPAKIAEALGGHRAEGAPATERSVAPGEDPTQSPHNAGVSPATERVPAPREDPTARRDNAGASPATERVPAPREDPTARRDNAGASPATERALAPREDPTARRDNRAEG